MCECYTIGGRFIAEDPDCPIHGREAQIRDREAEESRSALEARIDELERKVEYLIQHIRDSEQRKW